MRVLQFDSVGGASGDMVLAALLDLGADLDAVRRCVDATAPGGAQIERSDAESRGVAGTRVRVRVTEKESPHRHWSDVRRLIEAGGLPPLTRRLALAVFERLARAEGGVHRVAAERVHFHEVGAVDSMADVVGSCAALESLKIDAVTVGPMPTGYGTVVCDHGVLPVPAPATAALLAGHPVIRTDEPFELCTPTGAALLMAWKELLALPQARAASAAMPLLKAGHGLGHRVLNARPNLLRVLLLEAGEDAGPSVPGGAAETCLVIESNVDDTVPELLGALTLRLLAQGALDVFTTAVQMKKQRPGTLLTVLCRPESREALLDLIFAESTTFGVREYLTRRTVLDRRRVEVGTPYGAVRVKIGAWRGRDITRAPEHDDCAARAAEHGVPIRTVYEAALHASFGARASRDPEQGDRS